jgi:ribosomal protein L37AE/L43A
MSQRRAWSFLTIDGDREYQGNEGYDDDPHTTYRYDNFVANHLQVSVGDVAVIRSNSSVIGIAEIAEIIEAQGTKERFRCPECGDTNLSHRKTLSPAWRCKSNGHEFDDPVTETIPIKTFEARYGPTFRECGPRLTLQLLAEAVIRPSDQMSIKEIDLAVIEPSLGEGADELLERFASNLVPPDIEEPDEEAAIQSMIERREQVLRQISLRRGQRKFREKLIKRYDAVCQVSGCDILDIIEAAHIDPYSESEDNGVGNGLLLRSDIHTLFDLGYIGIEPDTLKIRLHPAIKGSEYDQIDGADLLINDTNGPALGPLKKRWSFFLNRAGFAGG